MINILQQPKSVKCYGKSLKSIKEDSHICYWIMPDTKKCKVVQELAAKLDIYLVYIPPYSPNLNLIERVWKLTKKKLRSKYFYNFALFRGRTDTIIESTEKENKAKIDRLIGEKVQLFDDMLSFNENTYAC